MKKKPAASPTDDALTAISVWYNARCNGEWERQYGVTIETADNPGWVARVKSPGEFPGSAFPVGKDLAQGAIQGGLVNEDGLYLFSPNLPPLLVRLAELLG